MRLLLVTIESWLFHMTLAAFFYRIGCSGSATGNSISAAHRGTIAHSDHVPVGNIPTGLNMHPL
jgi:hypothetical protein